MNSIKTFAVVALALAALLPSCARAQDLSVLRSQDVMIDSVTIRSATISSTTFSQLDTANLSRSFWVLIENLDANSAVCVSFDPNASTNAGVGSGCIRIDSRASGFNNRLLLKRWAQNLVIYARSLNSTAGSSEIVILQGR